MKTSPCKDCPDRHTACHGHCENYLAWKKELEVIKAAEKLERDRECSTYAHRRAKWGYLRKDYSGALKKFSS